MQLRAGLVVVALSWFGTAGVAQAALTSSERGQIRDYVARGQAENAARVRALVARTDLTADESESALTESLLPVVFNDQRAVFVRELVFGGSSASSRPLLAEATVKALLARADSVFQKSAGGLDREPSALAELLAIYTFIDGTVANAGRPAADAHDASSGISAAAYDDASKAMRDHLDRNARWLKGDGAVPENAGRVRAQAQIALLDLLPDGLTRRVDAVVRVGLAGARRQMLVEWGILLQDAGRLDATKAASVRQVLAELPGARVDLEVLYAGDDNGPLHARQLVGRVSANGTDGQPFGAELTPFAVDPGLASIANDLAVMAVKRALDNRGELRLVSEHDAAAAQGAPGRVLGTARAPSVSHLVGAAAQLLLLDASRTLDLAFARALDNRPESAALLSDAIGALAAFPSAAPVAASAGGKPDARGLALDLGKAGGTATNTMTAIRLAPNGAATGFTLDGHAWSIERAAPTFAVGAITRDGQPLASTQLATARPRPRR